MARRSDHTKAELMEMAINSGHNIIINEGFKEFSTRKVASQIGYTVGTIYNIFGTYDEFVLHINSRTLDKWYDYIRVELEIDKKSDPILVMAKAYINFAKDNYNEWITIFNYQLSEGYIVPDWYKPKFARFFEMVEEFLKQKIGKNKKLKKYAHILWAGIHGIAILSTSGKIDFVGAESPISLAEAYIENFLKGIEAVN